VDAGTVFSAAGVLHVLIVGAVGTHVLLNKQNEGAAFSWLGIVALSPFFGAALYWVFGINRIRRRAQAELPRGHTPEAPGEKDEPRLPVFASALPTRWQGLMRLGLAIHPAPYLDGNELTPLIDGDRAYPRMLEAIGSARASVVLSSYIFEYDAAGRRFVDALIAARARGVEVRVLIDGLGVGYGFSPIRSDRVLRRAGVPTARFLSFLSRSGTRFLNLRNHRKILSVDGRIAFVGGMNIRAGNLLAEPSRHHTQDVHFAVRGPVIDQINAVFAEDWQFATRETLDLPSWRRTEAPDVAVPVANPVAGESATSPPSTVAEASPVSAFMPAPSSASGSVAAPVPAAGVSPGAEATDMVARVLLDGPDDNYQKLQHAIIGAINVARTSIDVVTPYFLPPNTVVSALQIASLRGVRVRICVPSRNNLRFVGWAMRANVGKLVGYGIEIVASPPPFDHSKLCVVDDRWSLIGSSNWDARSLELNFEVNLECYDPAFNARLRALVDAKCANARPLDGGSRDPLPARLRNNFFRLFSPYL